MTRNQRIFADEYLKDRNATRAYRTAYPRIKNNVVAGTNGGRLLKNAQVSAYIREKLEEMSSSAIADAEEVLRYLTSVVRGEAEAEIVVTLGAGEGYSEAKRVRKNPDEKERLKAAEILSKYHQLLVPKAQVEVSGTGGLIVLQEATDGQP